MAEQRIRHKPGFDVPAVRPEERIFEEMGVRFERITGPKWWHPENLSKTTYVTFPRRIDSDSRYVDSDFIEDEPKKVKSTLSTVDELLLE